MTTSTHDADEASASGAGWSGLFARTWSDDAPEPVPPHPAPELSAHPIERGELPRGPKLIVGKLAPGWTWNAYRSRGNRPLSRKPWIGEVAEVTRLNLRHRTTNLAAVALWTDGKFTEAYVWDVCVDPRCARARISHATNIPDRIGSRDLAAQVSA